MGDYRRRLIWYTLQVDGQHGLVVVYHVIKGVDIVKTTEKCVNLPIFRCKFLKNVKNKKKWFTHKVSFFKIALRPYNTYRGPCKGGPNIPNPLNFPA